ncbi:hypothetical protein OPV22_001659 [Ensete ventricosum]|uniref:Uncharacterized protein n=1 Tax=Ensete ventricosum TaxID=4639 RepID=A0AAV8RW22_ENSVE|nr:hypothetical protein OPV22_001659 [Ensete ventricosum]
MSNCTTCLKEECVGLDDGSGIHASRDGLSSWRWCRRSYYCCHSIVIADAATATTGGGVVGHRWDERTGFGDRVSIYCQLSNLDCCLPTEHFSIASSPQQSG